MADVVIMPKQGQSVESCIISEFKVKVGDTVKAGDILFGYETDKATFEEESKFDGTVLAIFWKDGDEIPVLQNVMVIGAPGESFEEFAPAASGGAAAVSGDKSAETPSGTGGEEKARAEGDGTVPTTGAAFPEASQNGISPGAPASPRARRTAALKGVNLDQVAGSGPHGRILERDVLAAAVPLSGKARAMMAAGAMAAPSAGSGLAGTVKASDLKVWKPNHSEVLPGEGSEYDVVKMSNMRKLIARSMYNSLQNSAQLTHMLGADATRLQALRKKAKKALEEGRVDANVTINDFVCYAVIRALKAFPDVNSHCLGDAMRIFRGVHLGLAVDTERGLMVPALKDADKMDIVTLSRELKALADASRKGSVNPDLLSPEAASFTVSNLGGFGVEWFTPIINVPQSAILGVGTIVPRPARTADGSWTAVPFLGLSLTYDHRAIDGGEATRFLKAVATEIENLEIEI